MPEQSSQQEGAFYLDLGFVARCVKYLRQQKIHRHFAGYLCLCYTAQLAGRKDQLKPRFKSFFERFLLPGDAPQSTPYVVPFNESGNLEANVWMNSNVAGSYAISSLRPQAPLRRVADIFGQGKEGSFSLVDEHEAACLEHLLCGNQVNAVALAGFLFRDHSFLAAGSGEPTEVDLVNEFYLTFGFGDGGFDRSIFSTAPAFELGQVWAPRASSA